MTEPLGFGDGYFLELLASGLHGLVGFVVLLCTEHPWTIVLLVVAVAFSALVSRLELSGKRRRRPRSAS